MRLWSLHPRYLDPQGLVALWREALLAQAVIAGRTQGYRHHPQLAPFLAAPTPRAAIAAYLRAVHAEASRRGYRFDAARIGPGGEADRLPVSRSQLDFEWMHLRRKLEQRSPAWLAELAHLMRPRTHPLFRVVAGGCVDREAGAARTRSRAQSV